MLKGLSTVNTYPTYFLIEKLNFGDKHYSEFDISESDSYKEFENELQSRYPTDLDQTYLGDDIILPIQLYDNEGNEIIEPIAYDNGEPLW